MTIAITNASGFLGGQILLTLQDRDIKALGVDHTSQPCVHLAQMPHLEYAATDSAKLAQAFKDHKITDLIHVAGLGTVPQSIENPIETYRDNAVSTLAVLEAAREAGIRNIVLSSTASVYGNPDRVPIAEDTRLNPISPYGASLLMAERMVQDCATAYGMSWVILRYFNVAGADLQGRNGERGKPRHLIKLVAQFVTGKRDETLQIYGKDYPTPDGTCIRDYLHVADMADAHLAALEWLKSGGVSQIFNCGYGFGVSVLEVIEEAEKISGKKIPMAIAARREGDPPQLIADNAALYSVMGWSPRYDDLHTIVRTAIEWEEKLKDEDV